MNPDPAFLVGLSPIHDANIETLILGSFPSPASLAVQQYYAHPQNQFWRLIGALLGEPLAGLDYPTRQRLLLQHHVGVWDVYRACRREGALDSAIQSAEANDFSRLKTNAPQLRRICFNGKTSAQFARRFSAEGYGVLVLPSSSPAFTLGFAAKLERWREVWPGPVSVP